MEVVKSMSDIEENRYATYTKAGEITPEPVRAAQEAVLDQGDRGGDEPLPDPSGRAWDQPERTVRAERQEARGATTRTRDRVRLRIAPATHGKTLGLLIDYIERSKHQTRAEISAFKGLVNTLESQLEAQDELLSGLRDALKGWQANIDALQNAIEYPQGDE